MRSSIDQTRNAVDDDEAFRRRRAIAKAEKAASGVPCHLRREDCVIMADPAMRRHFLAADQLGVVQDICQRWTWIPELIRYDYVWHVEVIKPGKRKGKWYPAAKWARMPPAVATAPRAAAAGPVLRPLRTDPSRPAPRGKKRRA